ncbi:MAG: hypothetical protein LBQ57_02570 [Spirochaetales bacterium]|jgi:hypothetical protein|nr:hypothetical protein [Spirochaetales bacterium]
MKQVYKDKIIRYVLDSSDEENKNLALFIAGIRARKRALHRKKPAALCPGRFKKRRDNPALYP